MNRQIFLLAMGLMIACNLFAQSPGSIAPATQTVASGGSVSLTHSGTGGGVARQWQLSTDTGTSNLKIDSHIKLKDYEN